MANFRASSRKVSLWILVEEGLNYHLVLRNLGRFDEKITYEHPKFTYFWWVISLDKFIDSKKCSLLITQAYVPVSKIHLVYLIQKCSLRVKNHALVKVYLAYFCCVVWRKFFSRDSILVYSSTLWTVQPTSTVDFT